MKTYFIINARTKPSKQLLPKLPTENPDGTCFGFPLLSSWTTSMIQSERDILRNVVKVAPEATLNGDIGSIIPFV